MVRYVWANLKTIKCKLIKTLKAIKTVLLLSILFSFFSCRGQENKETRQNQKNSLGIGQTVSELDDKIWAVYQDKKGNYWFGSNGNGVYLLEGKNLRQITTEDGLIDNTIRGIQEDKSGNIFIETPQGISKFNGSSFSTLEPIISSNNEWKLDPDDLWFNCNGDLNDVYRYDGKNLYQLELPRKDLQKAFGIAIPMLPNPYSVYGIDKDKNGNIWFGTIMAGAFRFDGNSFLWVGENELTRLEDGRVPGVRSILEDKNGYFWLSNFISKYKIVSEDSIKYEKLEGINTSNDLLKESIPYFNSGLTDEKGDLWMTTYSGGVWKYDGETLSNFPIKDSEADVLLISIYQDNNGIIWLGTDNAGAYKYNGKAFEKFEPLK